MKWYDKAAKDLVEKGIYDESWWKQASASRANYANHQDDTGWIHEVNPSAHLTVGMNIRNEIRRLGYLDDEYGNLDDHYMSILNKAIDLWAEKNKDIIKSVTT